MTVFGLSSLPLELLKDLRESLRGSSGDPAGRCVAQSFVSSCACGKWMLVDSSLITPIPLVLVCHESTLLALCLIFDSMELTLDLRGWNLQNGGKGVVVSFCTSDLQVLLPVVIRNPSPV